jgi:hypothetical protein
LIAGLVIYFAIRYRRRSEVELPEPITGSTKLETLWTVIPAIIVMVIFAWGAKVFLSLHRPLRTLRRFMSWANSGCGSCNTWKASGRLTSCTSQLAGR